MTNNPGTGKRGEVSSLEVAHDFRHKPHHLPNGFRSPPSPHRDGRYSQQMSRVLWQLFRQGNAPVSYSEEDRWSRHRALEGLALHAARETHADRDIGADDYRMFPLTWLGQSCFYFRAGPLGVVTDPFLGSRASPFRFSGPKRLIPSPLSLNDLPFDVIVMSHNHYDHFCRDTLASVNHKSTKVVVTTLGLAAAFRALGYVEIYELDWYQQVEIEGVKFTALPAYHFSGRTLWDTDKTLWASFSMQSAQRRVFFAGDTGYGPQFARMGELLGAHDVALVPIGAYGPREVFAAVHADPVEAIRMGLDLQAKHLVGMHWGTVRLTTEPFWEPRSLFLSHPLPANAVANTADRAEDCAVTPAVERSVLGIGETRSLVVRNSTL